MDQLKALDIEDRSVIGTAKIYKGIHKVSRRDRVDWGWMVLMFYLAKKEVSTSG